MAGYATLVQVQERNLMTRRAPAEPQALPLGPAIAFAAFAAFGLILAASSPLPASCISRARLSPIWYEMCPVCIGYGAVVLIRRAGKTIRIGQVMCTNCEGARLFRAIEPTERHLDEN